MGNKIKSDLTAADYVHLHNHTQYSLLDGLTKVPALINYVKDQGMVAVAMTDHGTLSGVIDFYKEATNNEIKPVIGIETYVAKRRLSDKESGKDKQNYHLILLAMNRVGYQNLMRISTIANLEGFYYKPRIDHELLEKYSEGLIVLSGCIGGEVGDAIRSGDYEQALEIASWYKKVFGDRYYLEVQDHGHPKHPSKWDEQVVVNEKLLEMSKLLKIPAVVTCDAHYLKHSDQEAHEVLLCVQTSSFMTDEKRMSLANFELHVTEPEAIIERWGSTNPELILNTRVIADRCHVDIDLGKILIPSFEVPKGETEKSYLHTFVWKGLAFRYGGVPENDSRTMTQKDVRQLLPIEIAERADYELGVIEKMGFNGYFLIIHDFISWGKQQGIVFGPGRGSAAGSIIAYSLRITELDPLEYDLLFERFLNPDRISMPDVDIDIQDNRRDEVIQYCVDKYGSERVANIVTFGRMAARNAVRDVARVLQVPYGDSDRLAKMIPPPVQGRHIPLEKSLVENSELKSEYKNNPVAKRVFDLAVQMEGTIRSHGVHAAGVVIAPDDLVKFAPLEMAQKGVVSTQYPMGPVEELGLLKMDFLGLSNLTTIKNTLRIIKKVLGKDIDINTIPLDDGLTFELLQHGDTTGVFQFESSGMKRYLKELKPTEFGDVVAMGALYRPGPLSAGLTDSFIKRKNGLEAVNYDHPTMKPALESTYGVLVYQEQFMQISRDVCGFTGGEADTLRKAIGKKKLDMMLKMEERFIEGAVNNGVDRALIEGFWQKLVGFADYCFNKSHSACYGLISYQTAYLKAHYPAPFMAALMTGDFDDTDRLSIEIAECKHMGIEVMPPDINESFTDFAVTPDLKAIRFGMHAIKNVGGGVVEDIISARDNGGQFVDLEDFINRVPSKTVNKKTMESLIKAGAFDRFEDRSTLLHNLELIIAFSSKIHKDASSGQIDLFGNSTDETIGTRIQLSLASPPVIHTQHERLAWERELLGLYLSQHPLKAYGTFLAEHTTPLNLLKSEHDNKQVSIGGAIIDTREITTKKGQKMAFVRIGDQMGEVELILFPGVFQQTVGIWDRDKVVLVKGKVNARDRDGKMSEEIKIIVDDAREVTPDQADAYQATGKKTPVPKATKKGLKKSLPTQQKSQSVSPRLYLRMKDTSNQELLQKIKKSLDRHPGTTEAVLVLGSQKQIIRLPLTVEPHIDLLEALYELLGIESVVVK